MDAEDPRTLLATGQRALAAGQLDPASGAFLAAALRFSGPDQLLGGGHGWRGVAQVAMARKDWGLATRMLGLAERAYALGQELLTDTGDVEAIRMGLLEGRAAVGMLRADLALRRTRYADARRAIDAVYPLYRELGDRPVVADLWVTTARLAEREGRWFSARTAWAQVLRVRKANGDEPGQCDALVRMAEAMIVEDDLEKAKKKLAEAEELARYLEDETLQGRVHIAVAKILEHEHSWEAAWEKWLDAQHALREAGPMLRGLSAVRMARTAVRVRPAEAGELLQRGLIALLEAHHPDAVGLVLHQLAIVALHNGDAKTALLAAVGADRARGGDDLVLGVVLRALLQLRELDAAYAVAVLRHENRPEEDRKATISLIRERLAEVPDIEGTSPKRIRKAAEDAVDVVLGPLARSRGLDVGEVSSRRAAMKLTGAATETGAAERRPVEPGPQRDRIPHLVWSLGDGDLQAFALPQGLSLIGRGSGNAVRMGWDAKASRVHCAIEVAGDEVRLKDLASVGGTFVNGSKIEGEMVIDGEGFRVGDTVFHVEWRKAGVAGVASVEAAAASAEA
ncbi:MAG: FHA domain-containing protein [Alphaproteobacteria bacterium]|nr:FHA domain-containing protein [Alphaproteobacteria bacterium]